MGRFFARLAQAAGLEQLESRLMDRGRVVMHGPDQGNSVESRCHPREVFGDPDSGAVRRDRAQWSSDLRGGVGFGVERLELAGTTHHQEQNDRTLAIGFGRREHVPSAERQAPRRRIQIHPLAGNRDG